LDTNDNPLKSFGFGIESYIDVLEVQSKSLCFISIGAIILMAIYFSFGYADDKVPFRTKVSLGNLEGTDTTCINQFKGIAGSTSLRLFTCPKGVISNLTAFGALSHRKGVVR
jgi:hypothetical protein